jgi:hypothetical protein
VLQSRVWHLAGAGARPAAGLAAGLCLGVLALGPGLRRGFLLSYDMVFVPHESFQAALNLGGPPRAIPSDLVMTVAERVLPGDVVQKIVLLAIFALACGGAAALLRDAPLAARLAAGVFYTWNPYVAERLIIGQWALLLGYAGLPWVLAAALRRPLSWWRLTLAMLPAIVGGFEAMVITALVLVPVTALRVRGRARDAAVVAGIFVAGCLPWLVPSLLHPVYEDPRAIAEFAARADTPFGSLGSLVMLGGIWNAQAVPSGYGGAWSVVWFAVVLAALAGYILLARPWRRWPGLGIAAVAGLVIASLGITAAGRDLLRVASDAEPGFAVFRDGQQFTAPLALAEAAGFGSAVTWLMRPRSQDPRSQDAASRLYSVLAVVVPVLLLPGLAWGAAGRLRPAWYPPGWLAAASYIDASPRPGSVLLLPWASYRRPAWNHGEALLDPWPRLLSRPVIWNDGTQVGSVALEPDYPAAQRLNAAISGTGVLTGLLRTAGVRFVVVDTAAVPGKRLAGCVTVLVSPGLVVYEVPGG